MANGKQISALELSKVANVAFGGTMADNAYSIKDAYDAMELGVNQHILSMKDVSADKMLELLELLPTQTKRTEEMVKFWIEQLLETTGKADTTELTAEEIRAEIEEIKGTIRNEEIVLGISEFAEKNIEQFEAYLEVLEEMLNNKEVM